MADRESCPGTDIDVLLPDVLGSPTAPRGDSGRVGGLSLIGSLHYLASRMAMTECAHARHSMPTGWGGGQLRSCSVKVAERLRVDQVFVH